MAYLLDGVLSVPSLTLDTTRLFQLVVLLVVTFLGLNIIKLRQRRNELLRAFERFPGAPCHWLLGNIHEFRQDGKDLDLFVTWASKYPYAHTLWIGRYLASLVITHPDYAKAIFGGTAPKDNFAYKYFTPWIGKGLVVLSGQKWFQHRRLLTPGFHYDVLKPYVGLISKCTKVMLDKWDKVIDDEKSLELFHYVSLMTLDSIMKCAFSYESNCQIDGDNAYIKAVYDLAFLIDHRFRFFPYHNELIFYLSPHGLRFRKACKIAHQHTDKVIRLRKESLKNEKELENIQQKRHLDFLDILLCARDENGDPLSGADIRAEVDTFMFAGHDTTASGISWILYCMGKYPEHQEKCREEIKEILGERDVVQWDDLAKMTYLTMFIKETLRLYTPVPGISRELTQPVTFFDGRTLPAGSMVVVSMYSIHRDPTLWNDPEMFDPLRFLPDNSSHRHSHAYLPFAAGSRNCIGQNFAMNEMKTAVALCLQRFRFSSDETKPPMLVPQAVLRSKNGIHVNVKKIKDD